MDSTQVDSAPKRCLVPANGPGTSIPVGFRCSQCDWFQAITFDANGLMEQASVALACVCFLDHDCGYDEPQLSIAS